MLEKSFKTIVIDNIYKVMKDHISPVPDIIIAGDFNFPRAIWRHGIGEAFANTKGEKNSLQQIIDVAADFNLLQKVSFGTRKSKLGNSNILELIFTNNHELITNIYGEHSEISDHDYIVCETSHSFNIKKQKTAEVDNNNLCAFNYRKIDWKIVKAELREVKWTDILNNCTTSEERIQIILEIVFKVIDEHGIKFQNSRGKSKRNIPHDRRILLRNKKKLKGKLKKKDLTSYKKDCI